jgi:hypothetical protein
VKLPGALQISNKRDLFRVNPEIKAYLEKKQFWEDKKLHETKKARIILNDEVKRVALQNERKTVKTSQKLVRSMWQTEPRVNSDKVLY